MKLIIHADDFGMARSINEACIQLGHLRTLSSVSVMANMPYSDEVEKLLPLEHVSLGLHSTFTEGRPMSSTEEVKSLIGESGNFHAYPEMMRLAKKGKLCVDEIFKELRAQYEALRGLIGSRLSFVDSHHSIHNKLLPFRDAFIRMGKEFNVPAIRTRQMVYPMYDSKGRVRFAEPSIFSLGQFGLRKIMANYFYRQRAREYAKTFVIASGMLVQEDVGCAGVFEKLMKCDMAAHGDKVFYAVTHPATRTDDLPVCNLVSERLDEFNILRSDEFIQYIQEHPLTNFCELARIQPIKM